MLDIDITLLQQGFPSSECSLEIRRLNSLAMDAGWHATIATNLVELAKIRAPGRTAIVVIEDLPGGDYDVYALASILRCMRGTGIIMLVNSDSAARSRALRAGADICLSYPGDAEKFYSAVCAVARRCATEPSSASSVSGIKDAANGCAAGLIQDSPKKEGGQFWPDKGPAATTPWLLTGRGLLKSPDGTTINLTSTEWMLLASLFAAPRSAVSHEELLAQSGYLGEMATGHRRPLSTAICRLKKKCNEEGIRLPIFSSRDKGYGFDASGTVEE